MERSNTSSKKGIQAAATEDATFHQKLMNFLLVYQTTPHTTTGVAPCVLFLKKDMRTHFNLLRPDVKDHVSNSKLHRKLIMINIVEPESYVLDKECYIV